MSLKTYKVYKHNTRYSPYFKTINSSDCLIFDLEKNVFSYVNDFDEADIIAVYDLNTLDKIKKIFKVDLYKKLILYCSHTHSTDDESDVLRNINYELNKRNLNYKIICASHYSYNFDDSIIFYDFLFNRQKVYFTEYNKYDLIDKIYSLNATEKMYALDPILHKPLNVAYKKFLIPNKILKERIGSQKERTYYRQLLSEHITEGDCFYSDFMQTPPKILEPQEKSVREIWWAPIANKYYLQSLVSVYVESITASTGTRTITEKTFDPLIKGHFILPFSYCGIIHDLKTIYGFKFPEWIDYSYDKIADHDKRFERFIQSLKELRELDLTNLINFYNKDLDILLHNRQVFFDRPYDNLYKKLIGV